MKFFLLFFILIVSCSEPSIYDLRLKDLQGREFSFSELKGKPFIVYVWSGTCVGHVEDLKNLSSIYPSLGGGVKVISVALMMDREDVNKVFNKNGIKPSYPVLTDPKGVLADKVTLVFLPATLVFNERGELVENYPKLPRRLFPLIPAHE